MVCEDCCKKVDSNTKKPEIDHGKHLVDTISKEVIKDGLFEVGKLAASLFGIPTGFIDNKYARIGGNFASNQLIKPVYSILEPYVQVSYD